MLRRAAQAVRQPEQEGVVYVATGLYKKYRVVERFVRKKLRNVEFYLLLFAAPPRLDVAVEMAVPFQDCAHCSVRAYGRSLAREAQRLRQLNLLPIGSLHRHPVNSLSAIDVALLNGTLVAEMAPALLQPSLRRLACEHAEFEISDASEVLVDGQAVTLGDTQAETRRLTIRAAQAILTTHRARVFCLATSGPAKSQFHGQEVVAVRSPGCDSAQTYHHETRVVFVRAPASMHTPKRDLRREAARKLRLVDWREHGHTRPDWQSDTERRYQSDEYL